MKVLVTGGAGFIGSHIVDSLLEKEFQVVVYDNFSSGSRKNLEHITSSNLEVIEGDILDKKTLSLAMKGCQLVSHHAAQLEIFLAFDEPERDLEVNTVGTLNVLSAALENEVKKVVNVSSACVYGQTVAATKETDDLTPNWDYGVSKLAAEKYAKIFNDYKGLPTVSLRYSIVYGEREWFRRVLPIFIKRVINEQPPVVFGDGQQVRDFIYVKDVVDFHNLCLFSEVADGHVFNVGTGIGTNIRQLAEAAIKISGKSLEIIYEETEQGNFSKLVEGKKRNSAELGTMLLNIDKAKRILGWKPQTQLSEGLKIEYLWACENISRWDKIFSTRW